MRRAYQSKRDNGCFPDLTRRVEAERSFLPPALCLLVVAALVSLLIAPASAVAPVPGFTMNPSSGRGYAPLTVSFTDTSKGSVGAWWWEFGDGSTSTEQNPVHQYQYLGTFTVTLIVAPSPMSAMLDPPVMTRTVTVIPRPTLVLSPSYGKAGVLVTAYGNNFDVSDLKSAQADIFFNGVEVASNVGFEGSRFTTTFVVPAKSSPGSFTVQAIAPRDYATATFTVTNIAPRALIDADPLSGKPPLPVHFTGTRSFDEDGAISSYRWNFGDGTTATGATVDHTYTRPGEYSATLTVTDNQGESGTASIIISIANTPPVADARGNPTSGSDPLTVYFDGSSSYDPDGDIVSYHWNFGDDTGDQTARPTHIYHNPQSYTAVLTVTDDKGMTATGQVTITVGNKPPVAILALSRQKGTLPLEVVFDGSRSYDPDDTDLTYSWDFGDGTSGSGTTAGHTYGNEGTYRLSFVVTDPHGASDKEQTTIEVEPPFPWWLVVGAAILLGGGMVTLRHFRKPVITVPPGSLPSECRIPEPEVHVDVESGVEYSGDRGRDQNELPDISVEIRSGIWKKGDKK